MNAGKQAGTGRAGTGETVVLRPRKLFVISWVGAAAIVGMFVAIALVLRNTDTGVIFRTADQVALILIGVFIAGGILLVARPRVRADAEGVEVRNILVTRRLGWDQVERVAFPDGASWARLDLPDYEYVPVMALQAVDGRRAVDGIRRLRSLHAAARAG
ncbi:PH domain-containing protein [Pseudonocardia sp.]|uniref:PH domain-containing protein n=1 Tax=Pseudonocardia sp. TaxID=60912 RepID=UPI00260DEE46|nr:PH domain-containing protein [Pseudonocardia sp.]